MYPQDLLLFVVVLLCWFFCLFVLLLLLNVSWLIQHRLCPGFDFVALFKYDETACIYDFWQRLFQSILIYQTCMSVTFCFSVTLPSSNNFPNNEGALVCCFSFWKFYLFCIFKVSVHRDCQIFIIMLSGESQNSSCVSISIVYNSIYDLIWECDLISFSFICCVLVFKWSNVMNYWSLNNYITISTPC